MVARLVFLLFVVFFVECGGGTILCVVPLSLFFAVLPIMEVKNACVNLYSTVGFIVCKCVLNQGSTEGTVFYGPLFLPLFNGFVLLLLVTLCKARQASLCIL